MRDGPGNMANGQEMHKIQKAHQHGFISLKDISGNLIWQQTKRCTLKI